MVVPVVRPSRSPKDLTQINPALWVSRAAAAHFVGPLDDGTPSTFATLRVRRLAARETELTAPNLILLFCRQAALFGARRGLSTLH